MAKKSKKRKAAPTKKAKRVAPPKVVVVTKENLPELMRMRNDTVFLAYKMSKANGTSPLKIGYKPQFVHKLGAILSVPNADKRVTRTCAAGVNVGIPEFFSKGEAKGWGIFYENAKKVFPSYWMVAFHKRDIACLPREYDWKGNRKVLGKYQYKFRLRRCIIVAQVDPLSIGVDFKTWY
jgi:hypothetical protein